MHKFLHYWKFIFSQLNHMQLNNYMLLSFAFGVQLMILLQHPITWISTVTFIGTFLGTLCVIAINASKAINGWLGLLSGICFIIIGFNAKNYLSIFEQVAYMLTLDLPVLCDTKWNHNVASKMRKFHWENWLYAIGFIVIVTCASAIAIGNLTNDPRPWIDALSFAVALTGGIVCYLRYNNQYYFWLLGGIISVILWAVTAKQGDASIGMLVNYSIYVINDILAFTVSPWYNKHTRNKVIKENEKLDKLEASK